LLVDVRVPDQFVELRTIDSLGLAALEEPIRSVGRPPDLDIRTGRADS